MKKAISYALFGFERKRPDNCFDFDCYMRGLHINVRFNRILFPGWTTVINVDNKTYHSDYKEIFDWHQNKGFIEINLQPDNELLCKAMLWRLKPVWDYAHPNWIWSHVLCRDLDSIATYREAQMVQEWINEDKTIHCITDSVSHNIPMMGGMIGIRPAHLSSKTNFKSWADFVGWSEGMLTHPTPPLNQSGKLDLDYSVKGTDQTLLNRKLYPVCADSATEHFIKGMVHNLPEGNGRHYRVDESLDIGVDPKYKETNLFCGHVGAAGYYEAPTMKFLHYEDPYRDEYKSLEGKSQFRQIFYWG